MRQQPGFGTVVAAFNDLCSRNNRPGPGKYAPRKQPFVPSPLSNEGCNQSCDRGDWECPPLLCRDFAVLSTEIRLDFWSAKAAYLTCLSVGMRDIMPIAPKLSSASPMQSGHHVRGDIPHLLAPTVKPTHALDVGNLQYYRIALML